MRGDEKRIHHRGTEENREKTEERVKGRKTESREHRERRHFLSFSSSAWKREFNVAALDHRP
jgi:hypothetical protein